MAENIAKKYFGVLKGDVNEIRTRFGKLREELSEDMVKRERNIFKKKS